MTLNTFSHFGKYFLDIFYFHYKGLGNYDFKSMAHKSALCTKNHDYNGFDVKKDFLITLMLPQISDNSCLTLKFGTLYSCTNNKTYYGDNLKYTGHIMVVQSSNVGFFVQRNRRIMCGVQRIADLVHTVTTRR